MVQIWQIATGDRGRDFSALFLKYDLMFIGPSYPGPFDRATYEKVAATEEIAHAALGMLRAFCHEVSPGDLVLLRQGRRVLAIGVIHEEGYQHDPTFDDVQGWDLGHTRRVIWQDELNEALRERQRSSPLLTGRMRSFSRVGQAAVLHQLQDLFSCCSLRPLRPRPPPVPEALTLDALGRALRDAGLEGCVADRVLQAIEHQRRLLDWYREFGHRSSRPNEHEVVAHMILPLLRALGWSETHLAVEWRNVDIAGFAGVPTGTSQCVLVCEAKALWHGLGDVVEQAIGYVRDGHLTACRTILVTQGARFGVYSRRSDNTWMLGGYLNIEHLRTDHVTAPGTDAVETLLMLTPERCSILDRG